MNEKDDIVRVCAIALHDKMEHLDPQGSKWEALTEHEREFYRACAETVINEARVVR